MVKKETKQKILRKQEQKLEIKQMQMQTENDVQKPLGKALSRGFYYTCSKHRYSLDNMPHYKAIMDQVEFKNYYIKRKNDYEELKENFDGYASVIFIIYNFCCLWCENKSRHLLWKIYYNKSLIKIAKVIITGYCVTGQFINRRAMELDGRHKYVGQKTIKTVKTQCNPTYLDNTAVVTGFGNPTNKMLVPYENKIEMSASHPINTIIESLSLELKRFLENKPIQEIVEMCINKIMGNSRFVLNFDYQVYGLSGMFIHHISKSVAVILNHFEFATRFQVRFGSEHDVIALSNYFRFFKIPHIIIEDGSMEHVRNFRQWLRSTDFSSFDNLFICIMSHGSHANIVHTKNGDYDIIKDIRDPLLQNETCSNVKKFLLINKCRVLDLDAPSKVGNKEVSKNNPIKKLTISYSTELGYPSKRFNNCGSPYIMALLRGMKNSPFGVIDMGNVLKTTTKEVLEEMSELDFYQKPVYSAPKDEDLVVDVSKIENLYSYADEIICSSSLSTRPEIRLKPKFYDDESGTIQDHIRVGRPQHNTFNEMYSIIVQKKNDGLSDSEFYKIQTCCQHISQNHNKWEGNEAPSYLTKNTKKYAVIHCIDKYAMILFMVEMQSCPIEGLKLTHASNKVRRFEISIMRANKSNTTLLPNFHKTKISSDNPNLQCHNWEWGKIENNGRKVVVSLGLLDMERLEEAGKTIVLNDHRLKLRELRFYISKKFKKTGR